MIRIDAHQHYWSISRTDYGWLTPASGVLYRDYLPKDIKPHLRTFAIDATILVQAAPSVQETEFMLALARQESTVAGVVGWLDMAQEDFAGRFSALRRDPLLVGLRPMIQDLPSSWLMQPQVVDNFRLLADAGFPVDLQANPRHLPYILTLLERVPHLRAVIDHLAKPPIEQGELEPWGEQMRQIAAYPGVYCKLSGMVPEAQGAPWSRERIAPFARLALRAFGKERVMFGSDWPVCLLSASYAQVMALLDYCVEEACSPADMRALCGGNALAFYRPRLRVQGQSNA